MPRDPGEGELLFKWWTDHRPTAPSFLPIEGSHLVARIAEDGIISHIAVEFEESFDGISITALYRQVSPSCPKRNAQLGWLFESAFIPLAFAGAIDHAA